MFGWGLRPSDDSPDEVGVKLQVLSDLHFEFHADRGVEFLKSLDPRGADVLVLAGDITTKINLKKTLQAFCGLYPEVVYVFGNHELYRSSFDELRSLLAGMKCKNLHVLDNRTVTLAGQRFVGSSLWFPYDSLNGYYAHHMSDFTAIKDFENRVYDENRACKSFLESTVESEDVVVTHYLPSNRCVHQQFEGSPLNRFFVCEMDGLIRHQKPKLWIHGHTHTSVDCRIGQTRVVCNPLSYPHEGNSEFSERFEVEV